MGQTYFSCIPIERRKQIDNNFRFSKLGDIAEKKLLLLGASGSGKSTLFRQLKFIQKGMSDRERSFFKGSVYRNIIKAIKTIVCKNQEFHKAEGKNFELGADAQKSAVAVLNVIDEQVTPVLADHIKILWAEEAIQRTWRRRFSFQIQHSSKHYFENIDRIANAGQTPEGYIPTEEDITRCRIPSTKIVEQVYKIENTRLRILDLGGQRKERSKWVHCYEDVDGIIFVCALSGYNQKIFEDGKTNQMQESLLLFKSILRSGWFMDASVILFLNKEDLYSEIIGSAYNENPLKVPLSVCFSDCPLHQDPYKDGLTYIIDQFAKQLGDRERSDLYVHVTRAIDKGNIEMTFGDVQHQLIEKAMESSLLL
jgi:guanine nucleotide-binding protein G(i) subunit alpha